MSQFLKKSFSAAVALALMAVWTNAQRDSRALACFAVIVGREASADGSVLLGHNEENFGLHVLHFRKVPSRQYEAGAVVQLRYGGRLAQVPKTHGFLWSENPGLEFSDGYLNDAGVVIVSDGCPTREDDYDAMVARGEIRHGGIGYMLRRLVAERAGSAREGVRLVGQLVERFGYAASGRTYIIADAKEAWLVAVVRGRHWVAQRVPDDAVVILPNVYIIGQVDLSDTDNFLGSPDLVDYAVQRGWYDPQGGKPFRFDRAYQAPERIAEPDRRQWLGQCLVTTNKTPYPPQEPMPFAVEPAQKMTVASVIGLLRARGDGVSLFHDKTQEGAVFQLRPDVPPELGAVYWRTTGRPDTSVLTPWYVGITETPACYYRPVDLQTQLTLQHHFKPPEGTFEPDLKLAWWKFAALQESVDADYQGRFEQVRNAWDAMEARLFAEHGAVDAKALDLWKTDPNAARGHLTEYCATRALQACRHADNLRTRFKTP